jgi:hypothetical protein
MITGGLGQGTDLAACAEVHSLGDDEEPPAQPANIVRQKTTPLGNRDPRGGAAVRVRPRVGGWLAQGGHGSTLYAVLIAGTHGVRHVVAGGGGSCKKLAMADIRQEGFGCAGGDAYTLGVELASLNELEEIGATLAGPGWAHLPGLVAQPRLTLLDHPPEHPWREVAPLVGQVRQGGWYSQPAFENLPPAVKDFADDLARALRDLIPDLDPSFGFNEVTWQRHTTTNRGVSPHRDQSFYTGAIAVLTLRGHARFAILAARDETAVVDSWVTEPGDLTLLVGGPTSGADRRPWHMVEPPSRAERDTLTFRRTVGEPGGWE